MSKGGDKAVFGVALTPEEVERLETRFSALTAGFPALHAFSEPEEEPLGGLHESRLPASPSATSPRKPTIGEGSDATSDSIRTTRLALDAGEISTVELVRAHLDRARETEGLNAFITLVEESALSSARRADEARAAGEGLGPLHGIPISAKDIVHSRGIRTTSGSKLYADFVPEADAPCLASLQRSGAILLGKTNLHELAFGVTSVNPHYGAVVNPWSAPEREDLICGGSSGGSAASLAAGVGFGSIGTDTGGSIRIPSSLCGVVGLKPTYGAVSRDRVTPLSWSLDHVGPMARTVGDVSLLFDAMAGTRTSETLFHDPSGLRVAVHERYFFEDIDPRVEQAVRAAIDVLVTMGLSPIEMDVPEIDFQADCRNGIAFSEAATFHEQNLRNRPEQYGDDTRELLRVGLMMSATDYVSSLRARAKIVRAFTHAFERADVLVTPATVAAASPIGATSLDNGEELRSGLLRMASPFNTTGFPALSLPCGFTEDGRPIGLQLVARPWAEADLLRVGYAYERSQELWRRRPMI